MNRPITAASAVALIGVFTVSCGSSMHVASVVRTTAPRWAPATATTTPPRVIPRATPSPFPRDYNTPDDERALVVCDAHYLSVEPTRQRPVHTRQQAVAHDAGPRDGSVVLNGVVFGVVSESADPPEPNRNYMIKDVVAWVVLTTRWVPSFGPSGTDHTPHRERWFAVIADNDLQSPVSGSCGHP